MTAAMTKVVCMVIAAKGIIINLATLDSWRKILVVKEVNHWNIIILKLEMKVYFYLQVNHLEAAMTGLKALPASYTEESTETKGRPN